MSHHLGSLALALKSPSVAGVFGQSLEETVLYERRYGMRLVPLVVEQCVTFIRERGMHEVGLFRQPGRASLVKELQEAFDAGERPSFDRWDSVCLPPGSRSHVLKGVFAEEKTLTCCVAHLQQHGCPHGGVTAEALPQAAARASCSLLPLPGVSALCSEAVQ